VLGVRGANVTVKILDVRHAVQARVGQQQQTIQAANVALDIVDDCSCVLVLSFVPKDDGGFIIEVGVSGTGPLGFGDVVRQTLRAAADTVGDAMTRLEGRPS
jgi:hypothetical protein